jgi:hypothetical protein
MKTERRHDLKTNELADWLGKSMVRVEENYKVGLGIVAVIILIVAVWAYLRNSTAQQMQESWTAFQRASTQGNANELTDVATRYSDLPAGACARMMLADTQLRAGTDQLFADRADANDQLRRAFENYQLVIDSNADLTPIVKQRALLGLARAAESLNDLPRAREAYQQLADTNRWPQAFYSKEAQIRLDALTRNSTKEFYDWFAKQEPRPALSPAGDGASLFQESTLPSEPASSPMSTAPFNTAPAATAPPSDAAPPAETPAAETPAAPEGAAPATPAAPPTEPAAPATEPAAPPATEPTPPPANP